MTATKMGIANPPESGGFVKTIGWKAVLKALEEEDPNKWFKWADWSYDAKMSIRPGEKGVVKKEVDIA